MSFSNIGASPAWGTLLTTSLLTENVTPERQYSMDSDYLSIVNVGSTFACAAVNTSGVTKPLAGWITYTSGGGGGPTRPTSGFLYPRGQG
jgi:hypothetical protein